jgi:hypothetical protein
MFALHDAGRCDEARAVGRDIVESVRQAGRLRSFAQLLAFYTTMLAEGGDAAASRASLADALPALPTMAACEVLYLALGWLALHEGRLHAAAQLLAWFESPTRGCGSYGPSTFTRRTASALQLRLTACLDAESMLKCAAEGTVLGEANALRIGMAESTE